jgi:trehalose 6-phosphate phosphatase
LDFDGTLAPIVADPGGARPLPEVFALLEELGARYALVAVISGRSIDFLLGALGRPNGVRLYGLYGLEWVGDEGELRVAEGAERWRDAVDAAVDRATREAPEGVGVEPKGLALGLHWRNAPEHEPWVRDFAAEQAPQSGLTVQEGRMALELRPPVNMDKGMVIEQLAPGHQAAAGFGDDLGDLPAFAALHRLGATGMEATCVAVVDGESPPEVAAAADLVVDGPIGAVALLRLLSEPRE